MARARRSTVRRTAPGAVPRGSRSVLSRGLVTVLVATVGAVLASLVFALVERQQGHAPDDAAVRRGARDRVARPDARRHAGRHRPVGRRRPVALRRDRDQVPRRRQLAPVAGDRHRVPRGGRRRLAQRLPDRPDAAQPDRRDARHQRAALRRRALVHGGIPTTTTARLATSAAGSGSASRPRSTSPSSTTASSRRWSS